MDGRPMYAKLDGHTVVVCANLAEWMPWALEHIENSDGKSRTVAFNEFDNERVLVSTVFVGMNHGVISGPMWFETRVLCEDSNDALHGRGSRAATWEDAERCHAQAVADVEEELLRRKGERS